MPYFLINFGHYHQAPGASCGILDYPGLVSCPFHAIPIIIPFLIYEIFHVLVKKGFVTRTQCKNAIKPYISRAYCLFYA